MMGGAPGGTPVLAAQMRRSTRSRPTLRGRNGSGRRGAAGSWSATISAPVGIPPDARCQSRKPGCAVSRRAQTRRPWWSPPGAAPVTPARGAAMIRARPLAMPAAALGIAVLAGGALLLVRATPEEKFIEYRMAEPQEAPIAIAAGTDGSIWFTIDHADAIGRL